MVDIREELAQKVLLRNDDFDFEGEMPEMSFELDECRWASAEPDVGIMSDYLDDFSLDARVGDVAYTDEATFAAAVFAVIEPQVLDSREQVAEWISEYVKSEAENVEPPEPDCPEYDRYDD